MVLDHVGGGPSCVNVGVVDPGLRDHMLPQIIAAHVHELRGVQGAAAQMGRTAGMGGDAFKLKVCSHDGIAVIAFHGVDGGWMPGVYKIHVVEHPGPGHELFGSGAFLGGAAEVDDGAVLFIFHQIFLYSQYGGQGTGAQGAVPAAVARRSGFHRLLPGGGGLLAQGGESVIFPQDAHDRLSGTVGEGSCEAGGDPGVSSGD